MNKSRSLTARLQNEKGYTLVIVLMLLLLFSVLGMSLLTLSMNSMKLSAGELKSQSAYYIAEGGATLRMKEVEESINRISENTSLSELEFFNKVETEIVSSKDGSNNPVPKKIQTFEMQGAEQPVAEVYTEVLSASTVNGSREYKIVSKGLIGNRHRTVESTFTVVFEKGSGMVLPSNLGVYAKNKMLLTNGKIDGNLIINSNAEKVLEVQGNPTINGNLYVPSINQNEVFLYTKRQQWWIDQKAPAVERNYSGIEMELPNFPYPFPERYPRISNKTVSANGNQHTFIKDGTINVNHYLVANTSINLQQDMHVQNINFASNYKLTLDVGDRDISLVVNKISGQGHLDVVSTGEGKLTLYVKDNIEIAGHLNLSRGNDLFVYLGPSSNPAAPKKLKSSDYAEFNGNLYAADADVELVGSAGFRGQILTGGNSVKLSGATSAQSEQTVVFAPNATVELTGSGKLTGAVISKVFELHGGATVQGTAVKLDDTPFFEGGSKANKIAVQKGTVREK